VDAAFSTSPSEAAPAPASSHKQASLSHRLASHRLAQQNANPKNAWKSELCRVVNETSLRQVLAIFTSPDTSYDASTMGSFKGRLLIQEPTVNF